MALTHRARQWPEWPGFGLPEQWRRLFDIDGERDGWLRTEEFRDGDDLVVRVEIPGIDPDHDVELSVADDVLHIHAHRQSGEESRAKEGYRSEFRYGELERTLALPKGVRPDDVSATYADGILEVRVPAPAAPEPAVTKVPVKHL